MHSCTHSVLISVFLVVWSNLIIFSVIILFCLIVDLFHNFEHFLCRVFGRLIQRNIIYWFTDEFSQ